MLNINNPEKFNQLVEEALSKSANLPRWQNAIKKAVAQIEAGGEFMTFDMNEAHLVIWSQDSDQIYSANGVCQCKAFEQGFPCWHRAAARLVRNFFGLEENKTPALPKMENAPMLPPPSNAAPIAVGRYRI
jgi:hypothetical protein